MIWAEAALESDLQAGGSTSVNSQALERPRFRQRPGGRLLPPSAAVDGCGSLPFFRKIQMRCNFSISS